MRASLHCDVALPRSRAWPWLMSGLAAAALANLGAWALARPGELSAPLLAAILLCAAAVLLVAAGVTRVDSGRLHLEGGAWTFSPDTARGAHAIAGEVEVAIDAGWFMLLRFIAAGTPRGGRVRWLPAQRSALAHDWHALRCAVYSPRPAPAPGVAGAKLLPPE